MGELSEEMKRYYRKPGCILQGVDFPFKCAWKGCKAEMWFGEYLYSIYNYKKKEFVYYCQEHYLPALEQKFLKLYKEWDGIKTSSEFRNIFARYVQGLYEVLPEALSKGKLETRTNLRKYRYGVEFWITRHMNAFKSPERMYPVCQHWRFYIKSKKLKLCNEG